MEKTKLPRSRLQQKELQSTLPSREFSIFSNPTNPKRNSFGAQKRAPLDLGDPFNSKHENQETRKASSRFSLSLHPHHNESSSKEKPPSPSPKSVCSSVGRTSEPLATLFLPSYDPPKHSSRSNGVIQAYAAVTNQGLVRNYNEDRVSIIMNISRPVLKPTGDWPLCFFFGVFDGHGGTGCSDFLRDNLHNFIINEIGFPENPREAILKGMEKAEKCFLNKAIGENGEIIDKSGSCSAFALIIENKCYAVNVGDSRIILSSLSGRRALLLSKDHKPDEPEERKRIVANGGILYQ